MKEKDKTYFKIKHKSALKRKLDKTKFKFVT